jgi:uncharacterized membrane protein YidH (DUF202 family)
MSSAERTPLLQGASGSQANPSSGAADRSSSTQQHGATLQGSATKRIALPIRVEPKVYFANERTFLSWLNFAVVVGALAVGMLNFGDRAAVWSAGIFTVVALLAMAYALWVFHQRARAIRKRGSAGFDDRRGPYVLTAALFSAVIANFVIRIAV